MEGLEANHGPTKQRDLHYILSLPTSFIRGVSGLIALRLIGFRGLGLGSRLMGFWVIWELRFGVYRASA